jgi:hypothetical protein
MGNKSVNNGISLQRVHYTGASIECHIHKETLPRRREKVDCSASRNFRPIIRSARTSDASSLKNRKYMRSRISPLILHLPPLSIY